MVSLERGRDEALRARRVFPALFVAGFALMFDACAAQSPLVDRTAREFGCPPERINVIWRDDIAPHLFDVEACGNRARYTCVPTYGSGTTMGLHGHATMYTYRADDVCVREPAPPVWNPDPALAANLPKVADSWPSVCANPSGAHSCDCLARESDEWHWKVCKDDTRPQAPITGF
jgi:hypothetical protein